MLYCFNYYCRPPVESTKVVSGSDNNFRRSVGYWAREPKNKLQRWFRNWSFVCRCFKMLAFSVETTFKIIMLSLIKAFCVLATADCAKDLLRLASLDQILPQSELLFARTSGIYTQTAAAGPRGFEARSSGTTCVIIVAAVTGRWWWWW